MALGQQYVLLPQVFSSLTLAIHAVHFSVHHSHHSFGLSAQNHDTHILLVPQVASVVQVGIVCILGSVGVVVGIVHGTSGVKGVKSVGQFELASGALPSGHVRNCPQEKFPQIRSARRRILNIFFMDFFELSSK